MRAGIKSSSVAVRALHALIIVLAATVFCVPRIILAADADDPFELLKTGDVEEAAGLLEALANKGDANAQYALGVIYSRGDLGEVDYEKGTYWYRKAAEQDLLEAIYNLGIAYWEGQGVEQDFGEAFRWFRRGAELDYPPAQYNLATMYYMGKGTDKDLPLASAWFKRAAEKGHTQAQEIVKAMNESAEARSDAAAPSADPDENVAGTPKPAQLRTRDASAEAQSYGTPVYAFPAEHAPDIGAYASSLVPRVIEREADWVKVIIPGGALVWVYNSFITPTTEDPTKGIVTASSVRMRARPGTGPDSPVLGSFEQGARVTIVETRDEWKRVRVSGLVAGWMRSSDFDEM